MSELILKGIAAAPGVVGGKAFILDKQDFVVQARSVMVEEVPIEIARFEEALNKARFEIGDIKSKIQKEIKEHSKIFEAHQLVLEDKKLINEVIERIESERMGSEYIFSEVLKKYIKMFSAMDDEYLKERVSDLNDVSRRVLKYLVDEDKLHNLDNTVERLIIVSYDLSPSETVNMYHNDILGFVTDLGGKTSHSAIMAKSFGIPAVVGLKKATEHIKNQDYLIIDGNKGIVIVHPSDETKEKYQFLKVESSKSKESLSQIKELPAVTKDGKEVLLMANLELSSEASKALESGASGVGLYRTEFLFLNKKELPNEEEQFNAYRNIIEKFSPLPVTIRTLDLGGDKLPMGSQIPEEDFSYGRGIKFCLQRPDIFKTQLQAILRASVFGNVQIMYPMISSVEELDQANQILDDTKKYLKKKKIKFKDDIQVGIMIEVPAAAIIADIFAKKVDFFNIGTNDLIQFTLAIDRFAEEKISQYQPGHPAVIRLIKQTIEAAHNEGIKVCLCGEMASDPIFAFLLLGLNLDHFSMSAVSIPPIKSMIHLVNLMDAQKIVREVITLKDAQSVEQLLHKRLSQYAPGIFTIG